MGLRRAVSDCGGGAGVALQAGWTTTETSRRGARTAGEVVGRMETKGAPRLLEGFSIGSAEPRAGGRRAQRRIERVDDAVAQPT